MEQPITKSSKRKLLGAALAIVIVVSLITSIVVFSAATNDNPKSSDSLGVSISPSGSSFQLGVGTNKTFMAQAQNGTAPYNYTWTIAPTGSFNLSINGQIVSLENATNIEIAGENLTISYPSAVEDNFVQISVTATDAKGSSGESYSVMVADPYTSPGYKFDASPSSISYIVQTDGKGWYRAINGTTGAIAYSSSNASYILNTVTSKTGSTVTVGEGDFNIGTTWLITTSNIKIIGGASTRIVDTSGSSAPTIQFGNYASVGMISDISVENLNVIRQVNNEGTGDIIVLNGIQDSYFQNVGAYNGNGKALYLHEAVYFCNFYGFYCNAVPYGIALRSDSVSPTVNVNWFYGTLIAIGNSNHNGTLGLEISNANLNTFSGLDIEPRAEYYPVPTGVYVNESKGTYLQSVRIGEYGFTSGINVTGTLGYSSIQTQISGLNAGSCKVGVTVDYANSTDISDLRLNIARAPYIGVDITANAYYTLINGVNIDGNSAYFPVRDFGYYTENYGLERYQAENVWFFTTTSAASQTNKQFAYYGPSLLDNNKQIIKIGVTLVSAPGTAQNITVTLTDGVTTMSVVISDSGLSNSTTANSFTWAVNSKPLLLRYSTSSGCAISLVTVAVTYKDIVTS